MIEILFLCPGNATRSILAEGILRRDAAGRVSAHSAGSVPMGVVPAATLECLAARGIPTRGLRSKSWAEFAAPGAPRIDIAVCLCPTVAAERGPAIAGRPERAFWPVADPMAAPPDQLPLAFTIAYHQLAARIHALLALPLERMAPEAVTAEIGRLEVMPA